MLHQINLLFRRFLTDARQLFRFFVIVNLIPCILLVFTEPYSFMGKVILVTFPLGMYLFVFSWLKNIGLIGDRCRYVSEPGDDQRDGSQ